MEQPRTADSPLAATALRAVTFVTTLTLTALAASGCVQPKQRAVANFASHNQGDGRPLRVLPPFELSTREDAIVRVVSDVTCTGTLIAEDLVLTAHHCVAARDRKGRVLTHDEDPDEVTIELGHDYLPWGEVQVRAIVSPDCGYDSPNGDLAILVLTRRLIGVPTVTLRTGPPRGPTASERGEEIAVHGFGRCALSHDGIKLADREAGLVERVGRGDFLAQASICPGDSGGPVYSKENELIGVVSASVMDGDDKTEGPSLFTRLDLWPQLFSTAREIANGADAAELPPYRSCR